MKIMKTPDVVAYEVKLKEIVEQIKRVIGKNELGLLKFTNRLLYRSNFNLLKEKDTFDTRKLLSYAEYYDFENVGVKEENLNGYFDTLYSLLIEDTEYEVERQILRNNVSAVYPQYKDFEEYFRKGFVRLNEYV